MDEVQHMRYACLEQAVKIYEQSADINYPTVVALASDFYDFVKDGTVPPNPDV